MPHLWLSYLWQCVSLFCKTIFMRLVFIIAPKDLFQLHFDALNVINPGKLQAGRLYTCEQLHVWVDSCDRIQHQPSPGCVVTLLSCGMCDIFQMSYGLFWIYVCFHRPHIFCECLSVCVCMCVCGVVRNVHDVLSFVQKYCSWVSI